MSLGFSGPWSQEDALLDTVNKLTKMKNATIFLPAGNSGEVSLNSLVDRSLILI